MGTAHGVPHSFDCPQLRGATGSGRIGLCGCFCSGVVRGGSGDAERATLRGNNVRRFACLDRDASLSHVVQTCTHPRIRLLFLVVVGGAVRCGDNALELYPFEHTLNILKSTEFVDNRKSHDNDDVTYGRTGAAS